MKRLLLIVLVSIMLVSCTNNSFEETTIMSATAETIHATEQTMVTTTVQETTQTTTEFTSETIYETSSMGESSVEQSHLNLLEKFRYFPDTSEIFWEKRDAIPGEFADNNVLIQFRILGFEETTGSLTIYRVRIVKIYGAEDGTYDTEKEYLMAYYGTPENPLYDRPPLQIGKDYCRVYPKCDYMTILRFIASLMFPIEEIDGETYIYSYGVDLGTLDCAIEITDDVENQIFKPGIHDRYIELANKNGYTLPTFDYKCLIDDYLSEVFNIN